MAVSVSPRGDVGGALRDARARRSLSLEQAAQETRIHPRYLEALERDAAPAEFPAPAYARAFLREYARYLGLDAEPLVRAYRTAHPEPDVGPLRPPMPIERSRASWVGAALLVVSLAALGTMFYFAGRTGPPAAVPTMAPPSATPGPTVPPAGEETGRDMTRPRGVVLRVRVVEGPSWIRVIREDRVLFEGTADPGFARTFRSRTALDLVLGNAGATRLVLNGDRLGPPGESGEVYRATFRARKGEVRILLPTA